MALANRREPVVYRTRDEPCILDVMVLISGNAAADAAPGVS
jgi:hypothetical protein